MSIAEIKSELLKAVRMTDAWRDDTAVPTIERDAVLAHLSHVYEVLKTECETLPSEVKAKDEVEGRIEGKCATTVAENAVSTVEEKEEKIEPEITPEPESKPEPTPQAEPTPQTEPTPQQSWQSLFGDVEEVMPRAARRSIVMSLYDDDDFAPRPRTAKSEAAEVETQKVAEPTVEQKVVANEPTEEVKNSEPKTESVSSDTIFENTTADELHTEDVLPIDVSAFGEMDGEHVLGEILGNGTKTLADTIPAATLSISDNSPVGELSRAISLNDRMMICRELFDGDQKAYDDAMQYFDTCGSLDDCMLYIVDNYQWNSASEAATLMMQLLRRKYN